MKDLTCWIKCIIGTPDPSITDFEEKLKWLNERFLDSIFTELKCNIASVILEHADAKNLKCKFEVNMKTYNSFDDYYQPEQ
jgi:hypothetical protein